MWIVGSLSHTKIHWFIEFINSPCFVIQYLFILRLVHSLWAPDLIHWIIVFLYFLFFLFSLTFCGGLLEECKSSEFISSLKGNLLLMLIFIFISLSLMRDFILFGQVCV